MNIKKKAEMIKTLSREEKIKYLQDKNFRRALFKNDGHYPFVWLVQDLKEDELTYLLDDEIIPLLEMDSRCHDKLNAIITCGNKYNNIFLQKEKVISLIMKYINDLGTYLYELNETFGKDYFKYLYDYNLDLSYIRYLNSVSQLQILKSKENIEKIKDRRVNHLFLISLHKEAIEYLLNDTYFINIFLQCNVNNIDYLICKGVTLPINLQTSRELIDKYLNIENINTLNSYYLNLEKNNFYLKEEIKKRKKENYKKRIENIDKDLKIFDEYKKYLTSNNDNNQELDYNILLEVKGQDTNDKQIAYLQKLTSNRIFEMMIDLCYEELAYNFFRNLENMLSFVSQTNANLIPKERLLIYNKILNYFNIDLEEQIKVFNEIITIDNAMELFYDDFRSCLNYSYSLIKDSCFDPNNFEKSKLSTNYAVDVYELDGSPFNMVINHTYMNRYHVEENGWFDKNTASLSFIGDSNLGTYRDPYYNIILGFKNFNTENIMHVYHSDSFTSHEYGTKRIIELYEPKSLLEDTKGYNEILIKENKDLYPDYVVCYDEIKVGDYSIAKKLNIPLVLIHTNKYKRANRRKIDFDRNNYIYSPNEVMVEYKKER